MALTDENGGNFNVSMPVQPMGGGYGYGGGYGGYPVAYPVMPYGGGFGGGFGDNFGGDWIILFLFAMMFGGGWGSMGGFGGGFGNMFEFPWLLTGQQGINANTNAGFNQAALQSAIGDLNNNVVSGFGDVQLGIAGVNQNICQSAGQIQNSLCQGFAGTTAAVTGAQNAITSQLYNNELASLNRSFAEQTANTAGFNAVNSGIADTRYTIATEACATRNTDTQNTQAILTALTSGVQSIKDQLCADKIEQKNDEIAQLRQEILYTRGQAAAESIYQRGQNSQDVQTAQILAGQQAIPGLVYNRLNECPVSTVPVYGRQPIFTCNNGCGCNG